MTKKIHGLRILGICTIVLVLFMILAFGAFHVALFTDTGRGFLTSVISKQLKKSGLELEIGQITGEVPSPLHITSFTLKDAQGVVANINDINIEWSPYALLRGVLRIKKLTIAAAYLHHMPASKKDSPEFSLKPPVLPFGLDIGQIEIAQLDVSPLIDKSKAKAHIFAIKGRDLGYGLLSSMWCGDLSINEARPKGASFTMAMSTPSLGRDVDMSLLLKDDGDGVLTALLQDKSPFYFDLKGTGKAKNWSGNVICDLGQKVAAVGTYDVKGPLIGYKLDVKYKGQLKPFWQRVLKDQVQAEGSIAVKDDTLVLRTCGFTSPFFKLTFEGETEVRPDRIQGNGQVQFASLAPVHFSSGFGYEGVSKGHVSAKGNWQKLVLDLDGDVGFVNQGPVQALDTKLKGTATLVDFLTSKLVLDFNVDVETQDSTTTLPYSLDQATLKGVGDYVMFDDVFSLRGLNFKAQELDLQGNMVLINGDIHQCDLKGEVADIEPLAARIDLDIQGSGELALVQQDAKDALVISLATDDAHIDEKPLDALLASYSFGDDGARQIQIEYGDEATLFGTAWLVDGDKNLALNDIKIWDKAGEINGNITFNRLAKTYAGSLKGQVNTIDPLLRILGSATGQGRLELDCTFSPQKAGTDINALIKLRQIEAEDLQLKLGVIKADMVMIADQPLSGNVMATLYEGVANDWRFADMKIEAKGKIDDNEFSLDVKNLNPLAATFTCEGHYKNLSGLHQLDLSSWRGRVLEYKTDLIKPVQISWGGEDFAISQTQLKMGTGEAKFYLKHGAKIFDTHAELEDFPLALLQAVMPDFPAQGNVTGALTLKGPSHGPEAQFDLTCDNLDFAMREDEDAKFKGYLKGKIHKTVLSFDSQISAVNSNQKPLAVSLVYPLDFSGTWPRFDARKSLMLKAKGELDLADLIALWPFENDALKGRLQLDCSLKGHFDALQINGTAQVTKGYYENAEFGTKLDNLAFSLEGTGSSLAVKSLTATSDKGRLEAVGFMKLSTNYPYRLDLKLKDYPMVQNDEMEIEGGGDLRLEGDALLQDKITGKLVLQHATYNLPTDISGDLKDIFDLEEEKSESHLSSKTGLNIGLVFANPVLVKGWGIESSWRGALNVKGTLKEPAMEGRLKVTQGDFKLFGPSFQLTQGDIVFAEENKMIPDISVRAETTTADIKAILSVSGTASSPKIALSSHPDLPQDEILSRLLFRQGTANLSPYQAVKIAHLIGKFNGAPLPLLGQLESISETLGFDSFEIDTAANKGTSPIVKFGKRISDTVKATVEEDVESRKTQGKLQVELTPHVMLESGVSTEREGNIGIVGKWEY